MTNRLAQSQSLYLRKHAENPIDWWPWCDEALATAKQERKPIFLSIGYSSCHWCTVMEGEAFSDKAIANYMNENFLPIKVDREERPEVDSIYMQALQMMTGQGGWPLNIFVSPDDLIPFYGGTYFPVEPRYGRPGFLKVLQELRRIFDTDGDRITSVKSQILERLQQASSLPASGDVTINTLQTGLETCAKILTHRGMGPSFPMMPYAIATLHGIRFNFPEATLDAKSICEQRGLDLALGGIYDHVAGGFHRYTVDPTWTVPHFEKMLYDNGQIMEYLADLWALGIHEPAFQRAIAGTVQWLTREMTAPEGFFYAAQDADSFTVPEEIEPEEGAFYVWQYGELQSLLTDAERNALMEQFTITSGGNFEGKIVLQRTQPGLLNDDVERALGKLFTVRYGATQQDVDIFPPARNNQEAKETDWFGRIPPVTDTKMIVAWNSLMISGLARASAVLQNPDYFLLATNAAQFILTHQQVDGRLYRLNYDGQAHVLAQSEDYALLIKALLDLEQAQQGLGDRLPNDLSLPDWIAQAVSLQGEMDDYLWSTEMGGYFNTDARNDLVVRERSFEDNATPAANGVAIVNLVRLALRSENLDYLDRAQQGLYAFSAVMTQVPQACPGLFSALDWFLHYTLIRTTSDRLSQLIYQSFPTVVWQTITDLPENAVGLVCQGLSCNEPAQTVEQLEQQAQQSLIRACLG